MTRRGVAAVIAAAATALLASGCSVECRNRSDCEAKRGVSPAGQQYVCVANKCQLESTSDGDAGLLPPDAGGQPDAGPGVPDAGPDAGTVAKGELCRTSVDCQAGLRCEAGADAGTTCQAMRLAVTVDRGGNSFVAATVRYDEPDAGAVVLAEPGKWPRWNSAGNAVVLDTTSAAGGIQLVRREVVPTLGAPVVLTGSGAAGTLDFNHLEWGTGPVVAWTRSEPGDAGVIVSGIFAIAPDGGGQPYQVTVNGGFPSFSRTGATIAYNNAGQGLLTAAVDGGTPNGRVVTGGEQGREPHYNRVNDVLIFLRRRAAAVPGEPTEVRIATTGEIQPLYGLYAIPAAGGQATVLDDAPAPQGTAPVTGYWISYHTVSNDGTLVAYTRTAYTGEALTTPPVVTLPTDANDIYVIRLDPVTGRPAAGSTPQLLIPGAVQPSISPDSRFIAYVAGSQLAVQQIAVGTDGGTEVMKVGDPIVHTSLGSLGAVETAGDNDARPRWQPK
jgi:hypothetical protein